MPGFNSFKHFNQTGKKAYLDFANQLGTTVNVADRNLTGRILYHRPRREGEAAYFGEIGGVNVKNADLYLFMFPTAIWGDPNALDNYPLEGDDCVMECRNTFVYKLSRSWPVIVDDNIVSINFIAYREGQDNSLSANIDGSRKYIQLPSAPTDSDVITPSIPGSWSLTFNDEFDESTLNTSVWNPTVFGEGSPTTVDGATISQGGSGLINYFSSSQLSLANSYLDISTIPCTLDSNPYGATFVSGAIYSYNFKQAYGLWEVRAKIPSITGFVTAFWMKSLVQWPPEIDIIEYYSWIVNTTLHFNSDNETEQISFSLPNPQTEFHTYAVEWTSNIINMYVDGVIMGSISGNIPSIPLRIDLQSQVKSDWSADPTSTSDVLVDFVRIWSS